MDFKEYSSLIEKFFQGASSPEENRRLREMPEKEMEALFDEYSKDKWEHNDCKIPDETRFRLKSELLSKLHTTEERQQRNTRRAGHAFRYIAIAASICAAAVLGYTAATLTSPVQTFEVTADKGQKSSVTLPDGTAVTLNSASRITYTSGYNRRDRIVELSGEAYFDVARNEKKPFTVRAGGMDVTALGTEFNVKAYEEDREITATLVKGSIRADVAGSSEILSPNQYIILDKTTGKTETSTAGNPDYLVPWKNNELLFSGETLKEIARDLERMYNMEIIFMDDKAGEFSYTGLVRNSSLLNVLDLISGTSPVEYVISGNVIAFSENKHKTQFN